MVADVRVDTVDECPDDRRTVRVIMTELALHVAAVSEQPRPDVALELSRPEQFRHCPCRLSSPDLELKEPIPSRRVTLGEEEIVLVAGVDVRDAGVVTDDLDRGSKAGGGECFCRRLEESDEKRDHGQNLRLGPRTANESSHPERSEGSLSLRQFKQPRLDSDPSSRRSSG